MVVKLNVRWEVRFDYNNPDLGTGIIPSKTRKIGREQLRLYKQHPQYYHNVRMYRVSEFLQDGDPSMTFHRRAR